MTIVSTFQIGQIAVAYTKCYNFNELLLAIERDAKRWQWIEANFKNLDLSDIKDANMLGCVIDELVKKGKDDNF